MVRSLEEVFMLKALSLALQAANTGEIPVGAVVVRDGVIIGEGFNKRESLKDPTAHAEILALRSAASNTGDWRLSGCSMYVTLEPCPMCMGAILYSRIGALFYGASDDRYGASSGRVNLPEIYYDLGRLLVRGGVLKDECVNILSAFVKDLR